MATYLSQHFLLYEFVRSDTAQRLHIDNTPSEETIKNLVVLATRVLEPLRKFANKQIIVTSGFRCEQLNKAVGGAANSYHLTGRAADLAVTSADEARNWASFLVTLQDVDLCIYERQGKSKWLHVQWSKKPRHKVSFLIQ